MLDLKPLNLPGIDTEKRPILAAGPCSAETEEQVMNTARALAANGVKIFRAGIWKPRTKPGGFEGVGVEGLPWLQRVKEELGMLTAVEVASPAHVEAAIAAGIDIFWVGARTVANPFAVQDLAESIAGHDVPVLVKNPVNPDLELWLGALQRLNRCGIQRLGVIHRGFSTFEKKVYRNATMWHIPVELHRREPSLPIFCDPSHISGRREFIGQLSQQAMDLGFEGLMIESHCCPDEAWSDASQQITPEVLKAIIDGLVIRDTTEATESLDHLRRQIDECDNALLELLAKRMRVSREIGRYKKEHGMAVVQSGRYTEILDKRGRQGVECGMSGAFMRSIFELIHDESVRQQIEILGTPTLPDE